LKESEQVYKLKLEIEHLQIRLQELEETMASVCGGTADSIIVSTVDGDKVFTLKTEEQPYRLFIENMLLGAVLLSDDDVILYCNKAFADMVKETPEEIVGKKINNYVSQNVFNRKCQPILPQQQCSLQANDGSVIEVQVFVSQIPQDNSNVTCLVFVKLP